MPGPAPGTGPARADAGTRAGRRTGPPVSGAATGPDSASRTRQVIARRHARQILDRSGAGHHVAAGPATCCTAAAISSMTRRWVSMNFVCTPGRLKLPHVDSRRRVVPQPQRHPGRCQRIGTQFQQLQRPPQQPRPDSAGSSAVSPAASSSEPGRVLGLAGKRNLVLPRWRTPPRPGSRLDPMVVRPTSDGLQAVLARRPANSSAAHARAAA